MGGMKIAVTGKGGVGKTTLAATLAHVFAQGGMRVLAVDADPDANLAQAFGLSKEAMARIRPIAELTDLIAERTGSRPGAPGGVYSLNPRVSDIPEEYGLTFGNITLIITGKSKEAAAGCYCPENVFLRRLLRHLVIERDEALVLDMEAGIEHLTRGTAEAVDAFLVVVEPGQRSVQTAHTVKDLAVGLGVKNVFVVANKIRDARDEEYIRKAIGDIEIIGILPFDHAIMEADLTGRPPFETAASLVASVTAIKERIEQRLGR
jgi:CO dehydrogenase maturation factor